MPDTPDTSNHTPLAPQQYFRLRLAELALSYATTATNALIAATQPAWVGVTTTIVHAIVRITIRRRATTDD